MFWYIFGLVYAVSLNIVLFRIRYENKNDQSSDPCSVGFACFLSFTPVLNSFSAIVALIFWLSEICVISDILTNFKDWIEGK